MATLAQLMTRLRGDLDDVAEPYLWTDSELIENINRAIDEACLRARLIRDSDTPLVCDIRLRPGIARYDIHRSILGIRRARISGCDPMEPAIAESMDIDYPRWEDATAERPTHYLSNLDACWLRLYPVPTVVNTLSLTVWRKPINELVITRVDQEPEIAQIHHWNLLEWAKHLAYSKHDGDAHDPEAAANHASNFAVLFGERRSADVQEILRRTPRLKVRPHYR